MNKELALIITLGVLSYIVDTQSAPNNYYNNSDDNIKAYSVLLFHHIISIYILLGFLTDNKYLLYLYLLITINTVIHWKTNNDKCFLTTYVNKKFGIKETNTFRSIFYVCGVKATGNFFITLWIIFGWCVCIYKLFIYKNKKKRNYTFSHFKRDKDLKSRRLLRQSDY